MKQMMYVECYKRIQDFPSGKVGEENPEVSSHRDNYFLNANPILHVLYMLTIIFSIR